jgi:hypothetical protein
MDALPINENPENLTEGLKNFVAMADRALASGDVAAARSLLADLFYDVGSVYNCEENKPEASSPVPDYDPEEDGDYSNWLVSNNID